MKKTYITPALNAVKIETSQVLAGSYGVSGDTVGGTPSEDAPIGQLSNKFQGFIWEDDTEK